MQLVKVKSIKGCDNTKMIVPTSDGCKRLYCLYCKRLTTKFARHLENVHQDEAEVQKFSALPKGECVLHLNGESFVVFRFSK